MFSVRNSLICSIVFIARFLFQEPKHNEVRMSEAENLVIVDTDCGVDDAEALIFCISRKNYKVLGITCVGGNTGLNNVAGNVLRVLNVCQESPEDVVSERRRLELAAFFFCGTGEI